MRFFEKIQPFRRAESGKGLSNIRRQLEHPVPVAGFAEKFPISPALGVNPSPGMVAGQLSGQGQAADDSPLGEYRPFYIIVFPTLVRGGIAVYQISREN